ncbi:MAG: WbqC family protein [Eubacteriales bacterium]|nr:WbqC family protein [Eubacteriales bacterium]
MKLGIMQPYFFPYIGYWQLMNAVDKYVVYDDVNYIKGGWINRNRVLVNGQPHYINLPMIGASPNKIINEIKVNCDLLPKQKTLRLLEQSYKKAPFFHQTYELVERVLTQQEDNLAKFLMLSIQEVKEYLGIQTELIFSSSLPKDNSLKGQDKVLSICELLGATEYYNAIGGQELYSFEVFEEGNIALKFVKTEPIFYQQFGNEFQSNLSIIDVMMFNSKEEIKEMLGKYTLIEGTHND